MIKNLTSGKIISENTIFATSLLDKSLGMILKRNSAGLIFKTRFGIHTFFMRETIDVIILDANNIVAQIQRGLVPNSLFFWNPKFDTIIELPTGLIKKSELKVGDRLKF